ncbi:hypothetical protein [Tsukamurella paurometabola]|uniref:Uncharacterized protein n=1 Tax=Tsukamurella paurometabola TaxID=2061 RepID=A0ABS5NLQ4_TSUPA|nr:hypothetical protein [Tsukamurella paurometabola]MBS4104363.1 hypothetical protein [Tsukamurella paurometabola]
MIDQILRELDSSPWKNYRNLRGETIVHRTDEVRILSAGAGLILLGAPGALFLAEFPKSIGYAFLCLLIGSIGLIFSWRMATFTTHVVVCGTLELDDLVCVNLDPSNQDAGQRSPKCARVTAIFDNGGESRSMRVALSNGGVIQTPRDTPVFVAQPHDIFWRWRSLSAQPKAPYAFDDDVVRILQVLYSVKPEHDSADIPFVLSRSGLSKEDAEAALVETVANQWAFQAKRRMGRERHEIAGISPAGEVALASIFPDRGIEMFPEMKEPNMHKIYNSGSMVVNSPGAVSAVNSEVSAGSFVNPTPEHFDELIAALQRSLELLQPMVRADLGEQAHLLEEILADPQPQVARIQKAVRNCLRTGGNILQGALGSGAWAAWAAWSGLG